MTRTGIKSVQKQYLAVKKSYKCCWCDWFLVCKRGETVQCVGAVNRSSPLWVQLCFLWVCRYACCAQRPDSDKRPCSLDPWLTQLWQIVPLVPLSSLLSTLGVNFFGKQLDWMGKCLVSFERVFGLNIFKQMFTQLFRLSVLTFLRKIFFRSFAGPFSLDTSFQRDPGGRFYCHFVFGEFFSLSFSFQLFLRKNEHK